MASKSILLDEAARQAMERGANIVADCVKVTLGPRGRNVLIDKRWGSPTVTKDGVTVAKEIDLENRDEDMGAQLLKEVASKTNDVAGDGTTSATVLAQALMRESLKYVAAGASPLTLKRGIDRALERCIEQIQETAVEVKENKDISQVASIAGNDPAIGDIIADAMDKVGKDGVITVEEAKGTQTSVDIVEGMEFDRGYLSPYFVTDNEKMECSLDDPLILLYEKKISTAKDLVPILEQVSQAGKPLLIMAEDIEGEALAMLVLNKMRGMLQCTAVKAPGYGDRRKEMMEDLAALTGGQFLSEDLGINLENIGLEVMGKARRVIVRKEETTIIEGAGTKESIQGRVDQIRAAILDTTSDYDREKLEERLAKLSGGVAVVQVGAATETEMKEKKHRFEDALSATRAAIEEGLVAGGGVAYLRCIPGLEELESQGNGDERTGIQLLKQALEEPTRQICLNAGQDGSLVVEKVKALPPQEGYNAMDEEYTNMFESGIVDPAKVVRSALENASSIAGMILTTEAAIVEVPEKEAGHAHPPHDDYGDF